MRRKRSAEELAPMNTAWKIPTHVVQSLEIMARNTGRPIEDLVTTALKMFVSTHNDFLGLRKEGP